MGILWIIVIGFVAGIIARFLSPGAHNPSGFILTTVLGVVGAFVATFMGQAVGWYRPDQGAGFIGATIGAVIVLFVWHRLVAAGVISDPASRPDLDLALSCRPGDGPSEKQVRKYDLTKNISLSTNQKDF